MKLLHAHTIESAVLDCHLDPTRIRGQAYDGASSMSGKYKICAAVIERKYPKAKYTHCCSHVLNLAVVKACSLIQVQNSTSKCVVYLTFTKW